MSFWQTLPECQRERGRGVEGVLGEGGGEGAGAGSEQGSEVQGSGYTRQ